MKDLVNSFLGFFLGLSYIAAIPSIIALVLAVIDGRIETALHIIVFYTIVWCVNKYYQAQLEKERLEAEAKARQEEEQKAREEQIKKTQLENSVKYNKLCELFEILKHYREPIILKLNTLAEFKKYDKMIALSVAYDAIFYKYVFFIENHFPDQLINILAISENTSEYVREREKTIIRSIEQSLKTPVRVIWSYVSPQGRNSYSDSAYITQEDLREYKQHRKSYDTERFRRERERQKMTKSLRYYIMKRDNFKCQICGRTQEDGVKLEVDHKKPIAKGGKTEPDNLWTLCWDCNRGKADKYDEDDDIRENDQYAAGHASPIFND